MKTKKAAAESMRMAGRAAAMALALLLLAGSILAQTTSVLTGGLKAPTKAIVTEQGNLLVAEQGSGPNTGRISIVERSGARRTLIDGLPSAINLAGGEAAPSGPSGLDLVGRNLYVTIGSGDATLPGPQNAPGSEQANPNPSSPLLSSLLLIHFSDQVEKTTSGFAMTAADQTALKSGQTLTYDHGAGDRLTVSLITDFPDYVAEFRPDFPANVRAANPFGVAATDDWIYVVDASLNQVKRVNPDTGASSTFVSFPPVANTLPFGPPVSEAVPDSIHLLGDQLLVSLLTGFPFPPGAASVKSIAVNTASVSTLIGNLTTAIDVLPVKVLGGQTKYLVVQFSTNMLGQAPGQLLLFDSPSSAPALLAGGLISPTSVARDRKAGDLYVTEIFTGRIIKIAGAITLVRQHYQDFLSREPDRTGWDYWANQIARCGDDARCADDRLVNVSKAFFYSDEFMISNPDLAAGLRGTKGYNEAFVRDCYLRYLQRDPDVGGLAFWVGILNSRTPRATDEDYNDMIRAFLYSTEYRLRLGLE